MGTRPLNLYVQLEKQIDRQTKPNVNKHVTDNKEDACTKCYSNIEESVANCLEKVTKEVIFEHSFEG